MNALTAAPPRLFPRGPAVLIVCFRVIPVASAENWSDDPPIENCFEVLKQMTLEETLGLSQFSGEMPTGPGTGRSCRMSFD